MGRFSLMVIRKRIAILFLFVVLFTVGLMLRLAYLQLFQNEWYQSKALEQRLRAVPVDAKRGTIYDRNLETLAESVSADAIYAHPAEVKEPEKTARTLADKLGIEFDEVHSRLTKKVATVWIARKVDHEVAQEIRRMRLPGIGLVERAQRFYPHDQLAAHVLGIAGIDNQGLEGLELYYEDVLAGIPGQMVAEKDATGREIPAGVRGFIPPVDGNDLVLTIDHVIQHVAERELREQVLATGSEKGVFLAMDPKTGEMLAWAVYPSFDPNDYQEYPTEHRRNIAVTDQYEPGSTFKVVTSTAALEEGVVTPQSQFFDDGDVQIGGVTIHCWKHGGHGSQNFVEAVENSCNPVFARIGAELLGGNTFYRYIKGFGFGAKTGVDFPGEAPGYVPEPGKVKWGEIARWANVGFGQGVAVTPLQLLNAVAAIANDGKLPVPHLVKEIRDNNGRVVKPVRPQVVRQVISENTADSFLKIMRSVVVNGSGRRAEIEGYRVGGKTGTAQVASTTGRGYSDKRISSFVGVAPVDDPAIVAIVVLYYPKGQTYGGVIAAPVFKEVVEKALMHMGVPRRKEEPEDPERDSQGRLLVSVPNVRNFPVDQAETIIKRAGLQPRFPSEVSDVVLDQTPKPGAKVTKGTVVNLYGRVDVERLGALNTVTVPDLIGLSVRDAANALASVGLRMSIEGTGRAVHQKPQPGASVKVGTLVEVAFEPPTE